MKNHGRLEFDPGKEPEQKAQYNTQQDHSCNGCIKNKILSFYLYITG